MVDVIATAHDRAVTDPLSHNAASDIFADAYKDQFPGAKTEALPAPSASTRPDANPKPDVPPAPSTSSRPDVNPKPDTLSAPSTAARPDANPKPDASPQPSTTNRPDVNPKPDTLPKADTLPGAEASPTNAKLEPNHEAIPSTNPDANSRANGPESGTIDFGVPVKGYPGSTEGKSAGADKKEPDKAGDNTNTPSLPGKAAPDNQNVDERQDRQPISSRSNSVISGLSSAADRGLHSLASAAGRDLHSLASAAGLDTSNWSASTSLSEIGQDLKTVGKQLLQTAENNPGTFAVLAGSTALMVAGSAIEMPVGAAAIAAGSVGMAGVLAFQANQSEKDLKAIENGRYTEPNFTFP